MTVWRVGLGLAVLAGLAGSAVGLGGSGPPGLPRPPAAGAPALGEPASSGAAPAATVAWRTAGPDYPWSFPQDHWARRGYRTEWWYLTGHLDAVSEPRRFGYQFTFFRIGLTPVRAARPSAWTTADLVMGHAAVTDHAAGRHVFTELLYREMPLLAGFGAYPDPLVAWSRAPVGTDGRWTLSWNGEAFDLAMQDRARGVGFALTTTPRKPVVLQGPGGLSRKGRDPDAASLYYSLTRLHTRGHVTVGGRSWEVRGESWMDKEFGSNQLQADQIGWDWWSLQLADGRDLMLYRMRDRQGSTSARLGTLVSPSGAPRYLGAEDWDVRQSSSWQSPVTGASYPAGWIVTVPSADLQLQIVPELADQENRSRLVPDLAYWEGAVRVRAPGGAVQGRGYAELTGYRAPIRP